ncbi:MAG: Teneurin-3, partial [Halothiobacillaceae bacterium]
GLRTFLTDHLGSTIALADSSGVIQTRYSYDPFGNTTQTGQASTNPFQYTGRENDGTGLYYYRARYYSPAKQRFISEDPIGFGGGDANLYAYVGGDPINFIDPLGLAANCSSDDSDDLDWTEYILPGILIGGDILLGGPSGEGIGPALAILGAKQAAKKAGSLGKAKGTDALRRENKEARDAAKAEGLNKDQMQRLHKEISGQGIGYQQIREIARDIKNGRI